MSSEVRVTVVLVAIADVTCLKLARRFGSNGASDYNYHGGP